MGARYRVSILPCIRTYTHASATSLRSQQCFCFVQGLTARSSNGESGRFRAHGSEVRRCPAARAKRASVMSERRLAVCGGVWRLRGMRARRVRVLASKL
eukprot:6178380-Pleurochrysis_carterae.AAC.2